MKYEREKVANRQIFWAREQPNSQETMQILTLLKLIVIPLACFGKYSVISVVLE